MSLKTEKPVLQGQRIKTRKRDEKEKYDPTAFRDAIIQGLNETGSDLEQVSNFLDKAGSRLDYRRYAEPLLDVLFAGGILAPGGSIQGIEDAEPNKPCRTDVCVFRADDDVESIKAYYEVFYKLIRRYKYLEKSYIAEMNKLVVFLRGFQEDERAKMAKLYGISLANGLGNASCLSSLFEDHLVKDGLSVSFATDMFKIWLEMKDIQHISTTLRRAELQGTLMNLLPVNKRTQANFENHFKAAGLGAIVEYQRAKATGAVKKELYNTLEEMINDEENVKEIALTVKEYMEKNGISDYEAVVMIWATVMKAGDWNKKEELVAEQAMKHLMNYTPLFASVSTSGRAQLALLTRIQDYCYDNMNFTKAFQKIVLLLYKKDVLSEDVILKWFKDSHSPKGKTIFLEQMKKFVEWLQNAEEESEEED